MNKIKIGSVIACVSVILICVVYYSRYVSETIYDLRTGYPTAESCSARKVDGMPEGYYFRNYDDNDPDKMEVVEITWLLSNITNEQINVNNFWASYDSEDRSYLGVAVIEEEDLAIRNYENERVIPPGEQVIYTDYVLVPAECHEIEAGALQTDGDKETFTVTF